MIDADHESTFTLDKELASQQVTRASSYPHTILKLTINVVDVLGQVHVGTNELAVHVSELGTENGDLSTALDREGDVLGRVGESLLAPNKTTCVPRSANSLAGEAVRLLTIIVSEMIVKVDTGVDQFAGSVSGTGNEAGALDAEVLGGKVERHGA